MTPIDPARVFAFATREEWLTARSVGISIGASDVASILGVAGAFKTPWQVWAERMGHLPPQADNAVLKQGRRWERRVLEDYGEATGCAGLEPCDLTIVRHASAPWAVCSPDAFAWMDDGPECPAHGVEAKTDQYGHGAWQAETVICTASWSAEWPAPLPYVLQALWSLEVTGLPFWDLACVQFRHGGRLVWHRIMSDEALQAQLLARVSEWRERHLVRGEAPPVDDSAACSAYVSRHPSSEARRATDEEDALILRMRQHAAAARMEASAAKRIKNELAQRMAGAPLLSRWGTVKPPRHVEAPPPAQEWDGDELDFSGLHLGPSNGKEE